MHRRSAPLRPASRRCASLLMAGLLTVALPATISASRAPRAAAVPHARLERSDPAAGAVLPAPRVLRLTFSEAPELRISRVSLLQGTTDLKSLGKPSVDAGSPETLVVPVTRTLTAGRYTVRYRVTGRDGHPMTGSFDFTVR